MQPFQPAFAVTGVDSMLWPRAAEHAPESAESAEGGVEQSAVQEIKDALKV